ncbi:MAG TPA: amidohydrolase family protein [Steroidobacteraceae bacterium]|nr:amidohydrolase family protein [Steroidobacteraceae bacterium]
MSQLLIRCGKVFDGERLRPEPDLCIEVRDGRIASIGPARNNDQAAIKTINARDYTVLPGLIDAHFHAVSASLDVSAIDRMHPSHRALGARDHLEAALRRGFTTVRDAGGADIGLVRATEEGLIDGPRLLIAGKALSQTGGHGDMRPGESVQLCGCGYSGALSAVVDGADAMREKVRDHLRQGANHIKLFVSGGVLSPTDPIWMDQFSDEEIRAAVEEAATRRTYVMAHAHTAQAAMRCARNGVRSIEHGTLMNRESADVVAGTGAFVVPTMAIIESLHQTPLGLPPAALEKLAAIGDHAAAAVAHCRAAGVRLGLGTDLFGALRDQQSREFEVRGRHESSLDVLRSATSVNAELIGLQGEVGTLRAGAAADIIAVSGDPVTNVAELADPQHNLKLVVHDGHVILNEIARSSL